MKKAVSLISILAIVSVAVPAWSGSVTPNTKEWIESDFTYTESQLKKQDKIVQEFMEANYSKDEFVTKLAEIISKSTNNKHLSWENQHKLVNYAHSKGIDLAADKFNKFSWSNAKDFDEKRRFSPVCAALIMSVKFSRIQGYADISLLEAVANGKHIGQLYCADLDVIGRLSVRAQALNQRKNKTEDQQQSIDITLEMIRAISGSGGPEIELPGLNIAEGVQIVHSGPEACNTDANWNTLSELRSALRRHNNGSDSKYVISEGSCKKTIHISADIELDSKTKAEAVTNYEKVIESSGNQ